jgi:hypothetical protein
MCIEQTVPHSPVIQVHIDGARPVKLRNQVRKIELLNGKSSVSPQMGRLIMTIGDILIARNAENRAILLR